MLSTLSQTSPVTMVRSRSCQRHRFDWSPLRVAAICVHFVFCRVVTKRDVYRRPTQLLHTSRSSPQAPVSRDGWFRQPETPMDGDKAENADRASQGEKMPLRGGVTRKSSSICIERPSDWWRADTLLEETGLREKCPWR